MTSSERVDESLARNREQRRAFVVEWAEYVRGHPDDDWGEQVNRLIDSQLESARHLQDERPDLDAIESDLLDG